MKITKLLPAGLFLVLAYTFQEVFNKLVTSIFVDPVFGTIKESSYWLDFVSIATAVTIIGYLGFLGWERIKISNTVIIWSVVVAIIHIYYRFISPAVFTYIPFHCLCLSKLMVLDCMVMVIPAIYIYYQIKISRTKLNADLVVEKRRASGAIGFLSDAPVELNKENDKFSRWRHIPLLKENILATKELNRAFAIGIIGKWGSGKTTFILGIKKELEKETETNIIYMKFNPWAVNDSHNLTAAFFGDLAAELGKFDYSLKDKILAYSDKLLAAYDNGVLNKAKDLFGWSASDKSVKELYDSLNDSIRAIGRKLVIEIDDVDRLHEEEVIEVLKIVRNTADFNNTFFLVAFDRSYVARAIKNRLSDQSYAYLEKIFQLEFHLPISNGSSIVERSFIEAITPYLTEEHLGIVNNPDVHGTSNDPELYPYLDKYLKTERDAIRLRNAFLLHYGMIKNDVYFPDLLYMTILKVKYPEVYHLLYYEKQKYLTEPTTLSGGALSPYTGIYTMATIGKKPTGQKAEDTELYKDLTDAPDKYSLEKNDVHDVTKLVWEIFESGAQLSGGQISNRSYPQSYLSVGRMTAFDRYFDYSMHGRLPGDNFLQMMQLDDEPRNQQMDIYIQDRELNNDVRIKLEHASYQDEREFETLIKSIIYFANQTAPDSGDKNNFTHEKMLEKLVGKDLNNNKVLIDIYKKDEESYKKFIRDCFLSVNREHIFGYMQEFGKWLIKEKRNISPVTPDEIKGWILEAFYGALEQENKWNNNLFDAYKKAIYLFIDESKPTDEIIVPINEGIEMTKRFRENIQTYAFEEFVESTKKPPFTSPLNKLNIWYKIIFETKENFESYLETRKDDSDKLKEYYNFYQGLKKKTTNSIKT